MLGVVGEAEARGKLADRLQAGGAAVETGDAAAVLAADPAVAVAVGETAVVDLVRAGVDVPVLPVGEVPGLPAMRADDVPAAAGRLRDGDVETRSHRLLAVDAAGSDVGAAAFDVLLVRSEPGRISEYSLVDEERRSRFRADGVVAATPAGSHGYAHAAGGPRLSLDAEAVAVVPVAAFGLGAPSWVVTPEDGLTLRVERDEGDVSVVVDGRERRRLAGRAAVSLTPGDTFRTVAPAGT